MNSSSHGNKNPFRVTGKPLLMAHRGAPTECPENSLSGFQRAFDLGADVLELDVRRTRDGQLVVCHDALLDRTTNGRGKIAETSFAEIARLRVRAPIGSASGFADEGIPLFRQVLERFPSASFNVELKDVSLGDVDQAFAIIREVFLDRPMPPAILLTASSAKTQARIAENNRGEVNLGMGERAVYGALLGSFLGRKKDKSLNEKCCQLPLYAHYFGVRVPIVTPRVLNYLKASGATVHVWLDETGAAVDDPALVRKWTKLGVDGFFTDRIRELVAVLRPTSKSSP